MKALCMALYWQEQLDSGAVESAAAIAKREGMEKMRVHKIMKLARLPHDWGQQEVVIDALAG